ncbi:MAG: ABC transporter permease subunit [Lachnospiraceae bacterium]|nr:ABC transporter permease subunit [Lachnospiraceae bacterium]
MKIRLNPIVKKDLQVTVRSMRMSWGLFAYEAALTIAFLVALAFIQDAASYSYSDNIYSYLIYLFPVVAVAQVCIVALYVPIITASSISGEKERQTFDIMLTTCMSPFAIVFGKVISAVLRIIFFVIASTPIMALSFVVGGLSWSYLFYYLLAVILFSVFAGSIGIFASAFCRKSVAALLLSFVIYFVIFVLTFVPPIYRSVFAGGGYGESAGESMLPLLWNPVVFFEEFFSQMMTGNSIMATLRDSLDRDEVGILTYVLARGKVWMFTSAGCILLLSFLFMALAAWKVNPMHAGSGRRRGKKKVD